MLRENMEDDWSGSILQITKEFSNITDSLLIEQVQLPYQFLDENYKIIEITFTHDCKYLTSSQEIVCV